MSTNEGFSLSKVQDPGTAVSKEPNLLEVWVDIENNTNAEVTDTISIESDDGSISKSFTETFSAGGGQITKKTYTGVPGGDYNIEISSSIDSISTTVSINELSEMSYMEIQDHTATPLPKGPQRDGAAYIEYTVKNIGGESGSANVVGLLAMSEKNLEVKEEVSLGPGETAEGVMIMTGIPTGSSIILVTVDKENGESSSIDIQQGGAEIVGEPTVESKNQNDVKINATLSNTTDSTITEMMTVNIGEKESAYLKEVPAGGEVTVDDRLIQVSGGEYDVSVKTSESEYTGTVTVEGDGGGQSEGIGTKTLIGAGVVGVGILAVAMSRR